MKCDCDMTRITKMSIWYVVYDRYECKTLSGFQKDKMPTFCSGSWADVYLRIIWGDIKFCHDL